MTAWVVTGPDGTVTVDCDDVTTRADGSLWMLRETPKVSGRISRLVPVVILARGRWREVSVAGDELHWAPAPAPAPDAPAAGILHQATDIASDPLLRTRREAVAERLAQLESPTAELEQQQ